MAIRVKQKNIFKHIITINYPRSELARLSTYKKKAMSEEFFI